MLTGLPGRLRPVFILLEQNFVDMADHAHAETSAGTKAPLFDQQELQEFEAADAEAGSAIGRMLSWFFLYTVFAMTVSTLATAWWISKG